MPQRIIAKLSQVSMDVIHAPQTSVAAAGGTITASAADKLGYINSYGSTVGIYIGVVLSLLLIVVQAVKFKHHLQDRRVRIDNEALDRELSALSKTAHDELSRKKLELEIANLERQANG